MDGLRSPAGSWPFHRSVRLDRHPLPAHLPDRLPHVARAEIDATTGVFDQMGFEIQGHRIQHGRLDTIVGRQAANVDIANAPPGQKSFCTSTITRALCGERLVMARTFPYGNGSPHFEPYRV